VTSPIGVLDPDHDDMGTRGWDWLGALRGEAETLRPFNWLLGLVLVAVTMAMAPSLVADAFPVIENDCSDDTITYYFDNSGSGGAWASWQKTAARGGFADWSGVLDWDGGTVVNSLVEVGGPGGGAVNVELDTSPGGNPGTLGYAECTGGATISLNPTLITQSLWMEHWARHEMGHLLGLEHTGNDDSQDGSVETMATCTSVDTVSPGLSQDDSGNITHKKGDLDPETIHANAGWEEGTTFWGYSNLAYVNLSTTNPADGARALEWRPVVPNGLIYQTMNYAAAGGFTIDARTNHRKLSSSPTSGLVTLQILVRQVTYASNPQCSYPTGKDQNDRIYVQESWTTVGVQTAAPTTQWAMLTESTPYTISSLWDAADIRVRVKSNVAYTSGSGMATIATDTTRARDQGF